MTDVLGRPKELGQLRSLLDSRNPVLAVVAGIRGGGKSTLVRHAMRDYEGVVHVCPPLPDPAQRAMLAKRLRVADRKGSGDDASWTEIFDSVVDLATGHSRPYVLVLDDAHRLGEARSRFLQPLRQALRRAAEVDTALHVVLVGADRDLVKGEDIDSAPRTARLEVRPLPFRAAVPSLPGRDAARKIRAYGVFGGIPRVLEQLDADLTVGTNVRRLLLSPDGPLADAGGIWLERDVQTPARYYAIMRTVARGEADWAAVHDGVSDLTRSGQVAPYLKRLAELGLVEPRRSVDASPRGRARRYAVTDPFLAFWFRFVLPSRLDLRSGEDGEEGEGDEYARVIRPAIDDHMRAVFPMVCRQHMIFDAIETLGVTAREGGSLWGPGYDLPVAGILANGAAYFGACRWSDEGSSPVDLIEAGIRETRYGFGRERRLRLVFTGRPPPVELRRRVVRHQDAHLIDAEALMG